MFWLEGERNLTNTVLQRMIDRKFTRKVSRTLVGLCKGMDRAELVKDVEGAVWSGESVSVVLLP